jgi:hypothetical membrane protein
MEGKQRKLASWAGMIGPALFVAIFALEGWLRPGYDPTVMFISELSLGPRGWIQIINFIILGVLLLVFALGLAVELKSGKASKSGPITLGIIGCLILLSGPFVMDSAITPFEQMSWQGALHQLLGAFAFLLMPICCFVFWRRFRSDPDWRPLKHWTLLAGIIIIAAVLLLRVGTTPPAPPNVFNQWIGLIQRIALVTYLSWIFTFALQLYRLRKRN